MFPMAPTEGRPLQTVRGRNGSPRLQAMFRLRPTGSVSFCVPAEGLGHGTASGLGLALGWKGTGLFRAHGEYQAVSLRIAVMTCTQAWVVDDAIVAAASGHSVSGMGTSRASGNVPSARSCFLAANKALTIAPGPRMVLPLRESKGGRGSWHAAIPVPLERNRATRREGREAIGSDASGERRGLLIPRSWNVSNKGDASGAWSLRRRTTARRRNTRLMCCRVGRRSIRSSPWSLRLVPRCSVMRIASWPSSASNTASRERLLSVWRTTRHFALTPGGGSHTARTSRDPPR